MVIRSNFELMNLVDENNVEAARNFFSPRVYVRSRIRNAEPGLVDSQFRGICIWRMFFNHSDYAFRVRPKRSVQS